jgi:hypothetical protein
VRTYKVELIVDEAWLEVLQDATSDVYDGETCTWVKVKELVKLKSESE